MIVQVQCYHLDVHAQAAAQSDKQKCINVNHVGVTNGQINQCSVDTVLQYNVLVSVPAMCKRGKWQIN